MKNNNYSAYDIYIHKTGFQIHSICSCGYIDSFIPALCHFICFIPAIYLSLDIYHSFLFVVDFGGCLCACSNSLLFHHSDNLLALIPVGVSSKKKNAKKQQQHLFDPEDMTYESSHRCSAILISLLILSIICTYFFFIICLFSLIADKSEHIFASHPHISSSTLRAL